VSPAVNPFYPPLEKGSLMAHSSLHIPLLPLVVLITGISSLLAIKLIHSWLWQEYRS